MWFANKRVLVRKIIHNLAQFCYSKAMSTNERLARLETRAVTAEDLIKTLKSEVTEVRNIAAQDASRKKVLELEAENEKLRKEVEEWKNKLIQLEIANGIKQIPLPTKSGSNITIPVPESKPVKSSSPAPDTPKPASRVEKQETVKLEKKKKEKPVEGKKGKTGAGGGDGVTIEEPPVDVGRLDFRVGRIVSAKKHPDADSLYVEEVDVGEGKSRTVVSGLVKFVSLEEMQDRLVVLLCNLKPVKMRGVTSEAMVMCASTPEKVEILLPPAGSVPGDEVHIEGYIRVPDPVLNPKKKIFETVAPDLKTNADRIATYKGVAFTIPGKGVVTAPSLIGVNIK